MKFFSSAPIKIKVIVFSALAGAVLLYFALPQAERTNKVYGAISVWQNQSEGAWKIYYSIYNDNNKEWNTKLLNPSGSSSSRVLSNMQGNSYDPDISSSKTRAIAVWSNTVQGESDIYWRMWEKDEWLKEDKLSDLSGYDRDPTVYMKGKNYALVVWINKSQGTTSLYYSNFTDGVWSAPKKIDFQAEEFFSPELIDLDDEPDNLRYALIFNAKTQQGVNTYLASYYYSQDKWYVEKASYSGSSLSQSGDFSYFRLGGNVSKDKVILAWEQDDKNIWYLTGSSFDSTFNAEKMVEGSNPAVVGDSVIFSTQNSLLEKQGDKQQVISEQEPDFSRPDATALYNGNVLAVWHSKKDAPSEMYYSIKDAEKNRWSKPGRIEPDMLSGEDLNPSVTPVLIDLKNPEDDYIVDITGYEEEDCGDNILQAGEECEIRIPCKNKNQICGWQKPKFLFFDLCECYSNPGGPGTGGGDGTSGGDDNGGSQGEDDGDGGGIDIPPSPKKEPEKDKGSEGEGVSFGGFACGFNKLIVYPEDDLGDRKVYLYPESKTKNPVTFSKNQENVYSSVSDDGTIYVFPEAAGGGQPKAAVFLTFKDGGNRIEMRGVDVAGGLGLDLCTGDFVKGAKPIEGGLMPAPAPADNLSVPELTP